MSIEIIDINTLKTILRGLTTYFEAMLKPIDIDAKAIYVDDTNISSS